jgi:hypothetical protein
MPERSRIPGEPNAPAETRTSFVPRTMWVSFGPSGCNSGLRAYATPVARFSLKKLYSFVEMTQTRQNENALVESDVLHMHPRQEVQVRPHVLKRVDHVMRDIRAGARLVVDPSAPQKYNVIVRANAGDYARTLATSTAIALLSRR